MKRQNLWWKVSDFFEDWYKRLTCTHLHVMTRATFEGVKNWDRFSGHAQCLKCGMPFSVYIAKNEDEQDEYIGSLQKS